MKRKFPWNCLLLLIVTITLLTAFVADLSLYLKDRHEEITITGTVIDKGGAYWVIVRDKKGTNIKLNVNVDWYYGVEIGDEVTTKRTKWELQKDNPYFMDYDYVLKYKKQ